MAMSYFKEAMALKQREQKEFEHNIIHNIIEAFSLGLGVTLGIFIIMCFVAVVC